MTPGNTTSNTEGHYTILATNIGKELKITTQIIATQIQ